VAVPLPSGVVTFVMTDVEGSTRLWEDDAPRAAAVLAEQDRIVESAPSAHPGTSSRMFGSWSRIA
jgi:class 3 adenylate cyclase